MARGVTSRDSTGVPLAMAGMQARFSQSGQGQQVLCRAQAVSRQSW